jgi:hypothetical protein
MNRHHIVKIIGAKYNRYTQQVITEIKALPPECRQSGDDSRLNDVWEEFKDQVQNERSVMFRAYEDTIFRICEKLLKGLPQEELHLLWLVSDAYFNSNDDDEVIPVRDQLVYQVAQELFSCVQGIATDEPLESERDADEESSEAMDALNEEARLVRSRLNKIDDNRDPHPFLSLVGLAFEQGENLPNEYPEFCNRAWKIWDRYVDRAPEQLEAIISEVLETDPPSSPLAEVENIESCRIWLAELVVLVMNSLPVLPHTIRD